MGQFDNFLGFGSSDYDSDPYNMLGTGAAVVPDVDPAPLLIIQSPLFTPPRLPP